jgi:hypothetical protein
MMGTLRISAKGLHSSITYGDLFIAEGDEPELLMIEVVER